jgi:hypothetical protein
MLLDLKIKLKKPFLGANASQEGVRRFSRESKLPSHIDLDLARMGWCLSEAVDALDLQDVSTDCIIFETSYKAPKLSLYTRRWRQQIKGGKTEWQSERFESIQAGCNLVLRVLLLNRLDPATEEISEDGLRPPTVKEFEAMIKFVGNILGMSPWGNNFGYGRFKVLSVTPVTPDKALENVDSETTTRTAPKNDTQRVVL